MIFIRIEKSRDEIFALDLCLVIKKIFKDVIASNANEEERLGEPIFCLIT